MLTRSNHGARTVPMNPTDKVTCRCGMTAKGVRGCKRVDGVIMNYAKCPRCGLENLLGPWVKPSK